MNEDNIIRKVQALLAKAEDKACTPEEAEAFFAKAQELMTRHAIDEARLRAAAIGSREEPIIIQFGYSNTDTNIPSKRQLLDQIGRANGVRTIYHPAPSNRKNYQVSAVGFKSDLDFVQLLYASALMQCLRDARRQRLTTAQATGFMMGFAQAVGERLKRSEEAITTKEPGTDLVLASRVQDVDMAFRMAFPQTKAVRSRGSDNSRWGEGQASGRRADLSGGRGTVGSRRAIG